MTQHDPSLDQYGPAARIVQLLRLTTRPLRPGEVVGALGLRQAECESAFQWLNQNGYIVGVPVPDEDRYPKGSNAWSLGGKGSAWAAERRS